MIDYFRILCAVKEVVDLCPAEDQAAFYKAYIDYANHRTTTELSSEFGKAAMVFAVRLITNAEEEEHADEIDEAKRKEEIREKRRAAGSKGGKSRAAKQSKAKNNFATDASENTENNHSEKTENHCKSIGLKQSEANQANTNFASNKREKEEKEGSSPLSPDGSTLLLPPTPPNNNSTSLPPIIPLPSKKKEKERDKDTGKNTSYSSWSELKNSSNPEKTAEPSEPPFISLPLNTGELFRITEQMVTEWAKLYPAIDVHQELRTMRGWLDSNPKNRKTKAGIKRFVNSWLARAQDKAPRRQQQDPRRRIHTEADYLDGAKDEDEWWANLKRDAEEYKREQAAKQARTGI